MNCGNWKGLSEEARAVQKFTTDIQEEHSIKGASKVSMSLGDIRMYECPLSYLSSDTLYILSLVALIKHTGALLYDGGLAAQPHWLIEAILVSKDEEVRAIEAAQK